MKRSQPLTARLAAHPIAVRLARAGLPPTLAEAGVEGAVKTALRFDVSGKVAA